VGSGARVGCPTTTCPPKVTPPMVRSAPCARLRTMLCIAGRTVRQPAHIHKILSLPGLTRQSIRSEKTPSCEDRWMPGSSPGMTSVFVSPLFTFIYGHDLAISPRRAREFCFYIPPSYDQRAQGMPGARCARSYARSVESTRVSHHRHAGNIRHSPRNDFNGLFRALPGDRALLPPSLSRSTSPSS
jgi:hypothetical protein